MKDMLDLQGFALSESHDLLRRALSVISDQGLASEIREHLDSFGAPSVADLPYKVEKRDGHFSVTKKPPRLAS